MKLYLSSYRVPNVESLVNLVGKKPGDIRAALISNAGDYYIERARKYKVGDVINYFKELGITAEPVDLREFMSSQKIKERLENYDLIWLSGGNTFMLMEAINNSGFAAAIRELLDKGAVYGGESAGALVAGNSLRGVEYADDPRFTEAEVWDGMRLIDKFVLPHVGSPMFPDSIDKAKADHASDPTMVELTDYQALVIDGDKETIVESEDKS